MKKVAVFASGRGSNFEQLCIAQKNKNFEAKIALLIASKPEIGALDIAKKYNIPAQVFVSRDYSSVDEYSKELLACLKKYEIDFIALAGWLRLIHSSILNDFQDKIINIHPALLPFFGGKGMYGANVHKAVWQSGMLVSGATVHIVNAEYDRGLIIKQESVQLDFEDTPQTIAQKVLKIEHKIYPEALKMLVENKINFNRKNPEE
jgi:phosphoribosylglycinamide formyltransferase 1